MVMIVWKAQVHESLVAVLIWLCPIFSSMKVSSVDIISCHEINKQSVIIFT